MKIRFKKRRAFEKTGNHLLDFASSYLSEAFPNPDRQGCPSDPALRSLAINPTEGQSGVTEHLASCSPCFRRYGELLAELKFEREAEKRFSRPSISAWTKAHPVLAGTAALGLLLIAIGVGVLFRGVRQRNAPLVETNRNPNPTEPRSPTAVYLPFSLDLSALSPTRGSEPPPGSQRRVLVPHARFHLTLILPLASPESRYDLKLMTGGETFWSKSVQAHQQKGKTLIQVEADFAKIQPGNYNLEVRSLSGIRLIQPVSIQARLSSVEGQRP